MSLSDTLLFFIDIKIDYLSKKLNALSHKEQHAIRIHDKILKYIKKKNGIT